MVTAVVSNVMSQLIICHAGANARSIVAFFPMLTLLTLRLQCLIINNVVDKRR